MPAARAAGFATPAGSASGAAARTLALVEVSVAAGGLESDLGERSVDAVGAHRLACSCFRPPGWALGLGLASTDTPGHVGPAGL